MDVLKIFLKAYLGAVLILIAEAVALVVGGFIGAFAGVKLASEATGGERVRAMFIGGTIGALLFLFISAWIVGKFKSRRSSVPCFRDHDLSEQDLSGADLESADLVNANLYSANLFGANLKGAELLNTNLEGANLEGADLRGATDANLEGTIGTPAFMPDDPLDE